MRNGRSEARRAGESPQAKTEQQSITNNQKPITTTREHIVSRTLTAGIIASGTLMLIGFILYALQPQHHGDAYPVADWNWVASQLQLPAAELLASPFAYLYAGIFVLMLTPIVRIIITGWTFSRERDWRYVGISLIVLIVIGISIAFSVAH